MDILKIKNQIKSEIRWEISQINLHFNNIQELSNELKEIDNGK